MADGYTLPFSRSDAVVILEVARRALADGELFDEMAEKLDISDAEMRRIRDQLQGYMEYGGHTPECVSNSNLRGHPCSCGVSPKGWASPFAVNNPADPEQYEEEGR